MTKGQRHLPEAEDEKELPGDKLGDVLGDEESRALVADLMLEGCSDVLLTDEREIQKDSQPKKLPSSNATVLRPEGTNATRSRDPEVEIIDERKQPILLPQPQAQPALLQPLVLPALTAALQPIQPAVVMSLVTGADGQVYLLPSAAQSAQPPQPQAFILSSWPTPPSSVSPAASSVLSPTSVLSPAECPEIQGWLSQSSFGELISQILLSLG